MTKNYAQDAACAIQQLLAAAKCEEGDIIVVGCSTSEVVGEHIGTAPVLDVASEILSAILPPIHERGLFLAAQCCEHLARALVVEKAAMAAHRLERVNALPQPKAGGSFATAAWAALNEPVLVRAVSAGAGLDIGHTLIGMHLRAVAVPVRLSITHIGAAPLVAARTRPAFVGGERAVYDDALL